MNTALKYQSKRYDWVGKAKQTFTTRWKALIESRSKTSARTSLIRKRLRQVGLHNFDLMRPETFALGKILHNDETIYGAIVGYGDDGGSALIIVTNLRVVYLNRIPLFSKLEEMGHAAVRGVSIAGNRWGDEVILHTGMGDFKLYGVNPVAAQIFANAVETYAIDVQEERHGAYQETYY